MDLTDSYSNLQYLTQWLNNMYDELCLDYVFAVEKINIVTGSIGSSLHRYVKLSSSQSSNKRSKNGVKSSDSVQSLTATLISPNISEIETASCRYL